MFEYKAIDTGNTKTEQIVATLNGRDRTGHSIETHSGTAYEGDGRT